MNSLQDVLERAWCPINIRNARRLIASAELARGRSQALLANSRELIATEKKLQARWHDRRDRIRQRLAKAPHGQQPPSQSLKAA